MGQPAAYPFLSQRFQREDLTPPSGVSKIAASAFFELAPVPDFVIAGQEPVIVVNESPYKVAVAVPKYSAVVQTSNLLARAVVQTANLSAKGRPDESTYKVAVAVKQNPTGKISIVTYPKATVFVVPGYKAKVK